MIEVKTKVMLDGTRCFVWKDYYKNGKWIGYGFITRTLSAVYFMKKNGKTERRYTR